MSENCSHDCSSCSQSCSSRDPKSFIEAPHKDSSIKKVIGVISGKGGVGKSMISSMLAASFQKKGHNTAVLDADITGPSIPKAFGITGRAYGDENGIFPVLSKTGIQTMSVNLLLENTTDPVIWRGPVIAGTVKQFWQDVIWKDVDYMFVDMPPGTGDVALTVFQSIPVDGIVIVTSPQELVSMIVAKAVKMAQMMNVPIIGIIENMSYVECPCCNEHIEVFGKSHLDEVAKEYNLPILGRIPMTPAIAAASDAGDVESLEGDWFNDAIAAIEAID
ncbi:MAG: Mrp/NBP35 family ATP-binding protein [Lachnospiraceae bacterium]|nr:Mrp/NBP35 family ATP-binding protein [Lachnospiraceae bacterium]MBQ2319967.1 Mrp/NBP35 family ATP-binding protein [Lachnospiraceae bacterium]